MYKYFYCIFFFAASVLSLQSYGLPLTMRQTFTFLMFVTCFICDGKLWINRYLKLYWTFVFFYGISSLFTGSFASFLLRLIGDYFVAYVALWAIRILIIRYKSLNFFFYIALLIGFFDGLVTLLQFLGLDYLGVFLNKFQLVSYNVYLNSNTELDIDTRMMCAPGVFSHPVLNAHALTAFTILSLIIIKKNFLIGTFSTMFMLTTLFATQQRMPFLLGILCCVIYTYKNFSKSKYIFILYPILTIVLLLIGFELYVFVSNGDFRYSNVGLDSTGRDELYRKSIQFIIDNPLGGLRSFVKTTNNYPHNLIFSAFIYAGWIGGMILLYIVFLQIRECYDSLKNNETSESVYILALAVVSLTANGLTHNQSIINGEIITWTIWGTFYYSKIQIYKQNNETKINNFSHKQISTRWSGKNAKVFG